MRRKAQQTGYVYGLFIMQDSYRDDISSTMRRLTGNHQLSVLCAADVVVNSVKSIAVICLSDGDKSPTNRRVARLICRIRRTIQPAHPNHFSSDPHRLPHVTITTFCVLTIHHSLSLSLTLSYTLFHSCTYHISQILSASFPRGCLYGLPDSH